MQVLQSDGVPLSPTDDVLAALGALPNLSHSFDLDQAQESDLSAIIAAVRVGQRALDGLLLRAGARANKLAAKGGCSPARELLLGTGQVRGRNARRDAARISICSQIPGLADALTTGAVGGDHIDSLARHAKRLTETGWANLDVEQLLAEAARQPADTFDALVKRAIDLALGDEGLGDAKAKHAASKFRHWFDQRTGMGCFSGQLDPERYEALAAAIDQHVNTLAAAEPSLNKNANLAAEALFELVTSSGERSNHLPHITLVVDSQTLRSGTHKESIRATGNGQPLSAEAADRLSCDSILQRVTLDQRGLPIDVGRRYRTATNAQWAAIRSIHDRCAWAECQRPLSHCQLHHIRHWKQGGETNLANLVPLCSQHHHRVHEGQWNIRLKPDRALELFKPDGSRHCETNQPTRLPHNRFLTTT